MSMARVLSRKGGGKGCVGMKYWKKYRANVILDVFVLNVVLRKQRTLVAEGEVTLPHHNR